MQILKTAVRAAAAAGLVVASPGTAHATFPGENGVIVHTVGSDLLKVPSDGSGAPALIGSLLFHPAVSPDGRRVAAVFSEHPYSQKLVVMNLDGSNRIVIGDGADADWSFLAWSPDGKSLAHINSVGTEANDVYLYDLATLGRRKLANLPGIHRRIAWSPLGDKLVVDDYQSSQLVDVATGQVSMLPAFDLAGWFPDQSGSLIGRSTNVSPACVARMNADGSGLVRYPICGTKYDPSVAPDGSAVLTADLNPGYPYTYMLSIRDFQGNTVRAVSLTAGEHADWSRVPMSAMRSALTNNQWPPAAPLANDGNSYLSEADIAVMPDGAAGYYLRQVVGIGVDGRVYHRAQHISGTWTPYAVVPGVGGSAAGVYAKRVAIAGAQDGSAQVVIVGSNDLVYHAVRYRNGSWSGFNPVAGYSGAANFAARDVAIAIVNSSTTTPGQAHLVTNRKTDGVMYHRIRLDDGSWTPWLVVGNNQTQSLAIAFDAKANAYVLATTPSQGDAPDAHLRWWLDPWVQMSITAPTPLKGVTLALSRSSDAAWVGYVGADGAVWSQTILDPVVPSAWEQPSLAPVFVMPKGRTVSMGYTLNAGLELVSVQAQPQ